MEKENLTEETLDKKDLSFEDYRKTILEDYRLAVESREASLMGRREVLTGKAKFGIFGDGKEIPQLAMAKVFRKGDFRSGYYRDQTFMFATGNLTIEQWFAGLYAHTDLEFEPTSAGRQMGGHFATRTLDENGEWRNLTELKNSSADISPTAGQMPRLLGLAQASKVFRSNEKLHEGEWLRFSGKGNEVAFGTIGDASTSEGLFWETINAAGVLQVPIVMSVWDDGHGISVPKKYQTIKESISVALAGFQREKGKPGWEILTAKGWDYPGLIQTYHKAANLAREKHIPVLIHVEEVTQPQGHSTSGSHERYKSPERLQWEQDFDCIKKMREWILSTNIEINGVPGKIANAEELENIEKDAKKTVREAKGRAWAAFLEPIKQDINSLIPVLDNLAAVSSEKEKIEAVRNELSSAMEPLRREMMTAARKVIRITRNEKSAEREALAAWIKEQINLNYDRYSSSLYSDSAYAVKNIQPVEVEYADDPELVDGRIVLRENFDYILQNHPEVVIFGEDAGKIGDVNQGLEGLQEKHGVLRVTDTGIREATILGQGIGMAMRGLRPIAEIQYLDYLLYALQIMSDDLATVQYRTKGGQKAPLIVRTRGHRLEGIWHSGSPMGMIVNALRGVNVCVPRDMTRAAGMYNTLLESDEPALIIECLKGYRLKEKLPSNIGHFKVELGKVEVLKEGSDITLVSYGSTLRIVRDAAEQLAELGIQAEVIDIQTFIPFDLDNRIVESLKKTNRVAFIDEDVPGGGTAYLLQKVLEEQEGYKYLDSAPLTIASKEHRPPYGSDGDYFSKPSIDDIVEKVYAVMHEANPAEFPALY